MGTGNMAIVTHYHLVMDGPIIAVNGSDTTGAGEYFSYGISYDMVCSLGYVKNVIFLKTHILV